MENNQKLAVKFKIKSKMTVKCKMGILGCKMENITKDDKNRCKMENLCFKECKAVKLPPIAAPVLGQIYISVFYN